MTVRELFELYATWHRAAGHTERTIEYYWYELTRFLSWIEANGLQRDWCKPAVFIRYLADAAKQGDAPATVAGHYRGLRGFFGWLEQEKYLERSPMAEIKPPKVPKSEPKRATLREVDALVESIPEGDWIDLRDRLLVLTMFLGGLRLGECARMAAADYRTAEDLVIVRHGKTGARVVPMLPAVKRAFVAYMFCRPAWPEDELFLAADGARNACGVILEKGIYQMVRRRCKRAGLRNLNPHSFRHGLAMHLLNEGGDMSLVQKVLGHAQISTTAKHYAEWATDGMQREFAQRMRGAGQ